MPTPLPRLYSKDEELGKRDDDFRPKRTSTTSSLTQPWRWRKRRIFAVIAAALFLYVFVKNIPRDLGPADQRLGIPLRRPGQLPRQKLEAETPSPPKTEPIGAPPRLTAERQGTEDQWYYDGPIKYYKLAGSLHGIAKTMATRTSNRNVLFAVSSLQSAANLMPMACEMAKWDRNYVHMAFLGRDSLSIKDILEVNGVSTEDCAVFFHDARPDYSDYSTERRAEAAVKGAMKHIQDFAHPQAIIMDDSKVEESFHTRAIRGRGNDYGTAVIEVPAGRYEEFIWMTKLDSGSLGNWFRPKVEILVRAAPGSSGGLMRMVKSLEKAEYAGLRVPKLTVELPSDIEPFARRYLERLDWPPGPDPSPVKQSTLTLHRRITSSHLSVEQASVRFLESFYPKSSSDNHVLVLSPQVELSPLYLQYLHYVILEYRYSSYGTSDSEDLLGVSLDVPSAFLNGSAGFRAPKVADGQSPKLLDKDQYDQEEAIPFLYQAPSATASLIFGGKWTTFHDFLTHRLRASSTGKAEKMPKLVASTEPAWLEYLLELMRARGYSMLHPATPFVTVHNELAQIPEEYLRTKDQASDPASEPEAPEAPENEAFLTPPDLPPLSNHPEHEPRTTQPLHALLPLSADLPELPHLPYLSHTGQLLAIPETEISDLRESYIPYFRHHVGGCSAREAQHNRVVRDPSTDDLFCLPGVEVEYEDEFETAEVAKAVVEETGGLVGEIADGLPAAVVGTDVGEDVGPGAGTGGKSAGGDRQGDVAAAGTAVAVDGLA
ncbi:hypothetical protein B0A50_05916 [Salinomyces thailandicus]|uniref:Glycosyltransferase 2 n=1 Tax=Salinomyces thailandicus TaxID=706561 RepID=A0A4U0TSS9_9PEZI|nr:hypothetical protein B0A50_05916 [Salinomyces thailandica]